MSAVICALRIRILYIYIMSIGNRLNEAMTRAGFISQSALARACGISQPTVNRILKGVGKDSPDTSTLKKLAAATHVTFDWLNEGKGDDVAQDDDIAAIVMMLQQLEGRDRTLIRGKIEAWIEMMLGNIPEAGQRENTNLDRRNRKK